MSNENNKNDRNEFGDLWRWIVVAQNGEVVDCFNSDERDVAESFAEVNGHEVISEKEFV